MGPCENLKPRGLICNFPFCVRMPQLYPRPALTSEVTALLMIPRGGRGAREALWENKALLHLFMEGCIRTCSRARCSESFCCPSHHNEPWLLAVTAWPTSSSSDLNCPEAGKVSLSQTAGRAVLSWGWWMEGGIRVGMCGHRSSFRVLSPALRFNLLSGFATSSGQEVGRNPNDGGGFYAFWTESAWFVASEI